MSIRGDKIVRDGIRSVRRGMDSTTNPSDLNSNQLAFAVNVRTRGGFLKPRPGYKKKSLNFSPVIVRTTADFTVPTSGNTVTVGIEHLFGLEVDQKVAIGGSGTLNVETIDRNNSTVELKNEGSANAGTTIQSALGLYDAEVESNFKDGLFQGATVYEARDGRSYIIASIGGRIFKIDPEEGFRVTDISIDGDLNSSQEPTVWFAQAEEFLIIQDGLSAPLIYDGSSMRRSNPLGPKPEVPTGRQMAYGNGRLWVAVSARSFVAGDLVYSPSGTGAYNFRDAVLKFTENTFLNEGGSFAVPESAGDIRAMEFIPALDTSLGQGPLQVFTTNGVFTVNAPVDRTVWKDLEQPLQTVALRNAGGLGPVVPINNDLWFRSRDGLRSLRQAARDFSQWGNTPLSSEVERILNDDDQRLLEYGSGVFFDNRLLWTTAPKRDFDHGTFHNGLVVMDFNPISGLTTNEPPVWDGLWTGVKTLQVLTGEFDKLKRCYDFVLNSSDEIELWEITRDDPFDEGETRIEWQVEGASLAFNDGGNDEKRLDGGDIFIDALGGTVDFSVYYRPDQYPGWFLWHSFQEQATIEICDPCDLTLKREQYRPRIGLPQPSNQENDALGRRLRNAFEFQTRLVVTGSCRVRILRLKAIQAPEPEDAALGTSTSTSSEIAQCPIDPYSYSI